ncbi:MAG: transporter substrate-binding domain-containing protein, partial [Gammaproteobacteria bacterium]|nr:transporter substrate-binding domain-containing protein [Gammaproteobacteria bacterium]
VLNAATQDALRFGVVPATSERFLRAQIAAAKEIQAYWFGRWRTEGGPVDAADLVSEIRPELIRLGTQVLAALQQRADPHDWNEFARTVAVTGLSEKSLAALYRAVAEIRLFEHRLAQILSTGQMRIGTPGDYAPFSVWSADTGSYLGIDVDLARELAAALGVEPVFVETSWPTLLKDLAAGRYDIAVGGVSRTRDREKLGYLSSAYHVGGKTPIARCSDAARFATLAGIDQADVRLIVNPGGTNERYVDQHIHRAQKTVHDDNLTIFQEILDGTADVMITDRIEAQWQVSRRPGLCLTMPGTLTHQEKAFLLPQDAQWLDFVNGWLDQQIAAGTVAATFKRHLEENAPEVNTREVPE